LLLRIKVDVLVEGVKIVALAWHCHEENLLCDSVEFANRCTWVNNVFESVRAGNNIKTLVIEGQCFDVSRNQLHAFVGQLVDNITTNKFQVGTSFSHATEKVTAPT